MSMGMLEDQRYHTVSIQKTERMKYLIVVCLSFKNVNINSLFNSSYKTIENYFKITFLSTLKTSFE